MRPPVLRISNDELIVDNFAGGGGASTGIAWALGRSPDIAVNHDPEALALHEANHPTTRHLCEDVFDVDPVKVCAGRPVGLAWFSPDCTFFSKARGKRPFRDKNKARRRRGLAGVVLRWAAAVRPRVIAMENVEEFQEWGPLGDDGLPDPARRGFSFRRWWARLENLGYHIEMGELRGMDYGAPTTRKRLFVVARCDGLPIVWPEKSHGKGFKWAVRTSAECIDWTLPVHSIFLTKEEARKVGVKRPLAEATMRRIARGFWRYVAGTAEPFVIPLTHHGERKPALGHEPMPTITGAHRGELAIVTPYLAGVGGRKGQSPETPVTRPYHTITAKNDTVLIAPTLINTRNGERHGRHGEQAPRVIDIKEPYPTITAVGSQGALVAAFLARHYGGHENDGAPLQQSLPTITARDHHAVVTSNLVHLRGTCADGQPLDEPLTTITGGGNHHAEVRCFLMKYYGNEEHQEQQLSMPLHTITTKARFGLVTVTIAGQEYAVVDIGMRMLAPHELFRAQGFGPDYLTNTLVNGKPLTKEAQIRLVGNSVCPPVAEALVRAQFQERASEAAG